MRKATILLSFLLNACASAAAYRAPEVQIPAAFRERLDSLAPRAQPSPDAVPMAAADTTPVGEYWRSLGDTTLNRLLQQAYVYRDMFALFRQYQDEESCAGEVPSHRSALPALGLGPACQSGSRLQPGRVSSR